MKLLNLGCGNRYSTNKEWTNIDMVSTGENVIACDLKKGIPFPDETFDLVYHSHVFEHIPKSESDAFIKECKRVLRPNGILRIVVPDLEQIVLNYIRLLNEGAGNIDSPEIAADYDWIMLEMYDQTVRNKSGGEMIPFLSDQNLSNQKFIAERCGYEMQNLIRHLNNKKIKESIKNTPSKANLIHTILNYLQNKELIRRMFLRIFFEKEYNLLYRDNKAYEIGKFREQGEVHQWMYDRYSLHRILKTNLLRNIKIQKASESYLDS